MSPQCRICEKPLSERDALREDRVCESCRLDACMIREWKKSTIFGGDNRPTHTLPEGDMR